LSKNADACEPIAAIDPWAAFPRACYQRMLVKGNVYMAIINYTSPFPSGVDFDCLQRKLAMHGALASAIASMRQLGASSKEIAAALRFAASRAELDETEATPDGV
jgi:hypothetical protein